VATLHQRSGEVVSYDELFEVVKSGRNRELRLDPDDLAALRSLAPGRKAPVRCRSG